MTTENLKEKLQTGTPGHREYKWRPGHNYKGDDGGTGKIYKWRPGHRDCSKRNYRPDTGKQMTTGMLGHREYKWRPRHSKRKYRLGHRDTNDDRNTGNINNDQDTGTQLQGGVPGGTGGYINDDGDTGNVWLAISINKAKGQSLE